jgi:ribose-phosphate pyrophosphokinase
MRAAWNAREILRQEAGSPLAIVDKRRTDINVTEVMNVIGDVQGKDLPHPRRHRRHGRHAGEDRRCAAGEGRDKVYACASHAVLSGPAIERIADSRLKSWW